MATVLQRLTCSVYFVDALFTVLLKMSSSDKEFLPSPQRYVEEKKCPKKSRCHSIERTKDRKKVLKVSSSIFGRCSSNELNAARQDDPIPGPSQETNHKQLFRCPKCLRYFDSGTELIEHLHDHENTGKDRKFRCRKCNSENVISYVHYEGFYHGDPDRRVIGMHCEECLKKIFGTE